MSVELLKHANKTRVGTAHFYKMDMRQITLQTDSFDGIWACASLLHLTHKEVPAVLSRLYALLKSDGTMFVSVKVGEGEGMAASDSIPGQKRFFSYYSTDELENLLRSAGFLITDIYTWDQHDRNSERSPQVWISCFVRKQ